MTINSKVIRAAVALGLALAFVACGGKSDTPATSPAAPTAAPTTPTVVGGATVTGTVAVSSGAATASGFRGLLDTTYTIVVSVEGTSLSTVADDAGRFNLTGVPSGTVQLKFSGSGVQGSVTLTGVKEADQISVSVTLTPTGASVDKSQQSDPAGSVELEGRISALKPGGAANTVTVDDTVVTIATSAVIRHGSTDLKFDDLKVGDRVHVKGTKNGQAITATEVMVQNDNVAVPLNLNGDVTGLLTGFSCPAVRVHVKGTKNGQAITATEVMVQNDNVAVPLNLNGDVTGLLTGFSCPAVRFTLQGWTVEADASTSFEKGSCSSIVKGTSVHVKGTVQSSGRVLATWVQIGK